MDDRDGIRRPRPVDDQPRRPRPVEDDEDYPRRRPPPRPGARNLSVVGLVSLIIGIISFALSLVPCLNLFTWPLQVIGLILALVGVCISAFGQREGLGLPIAGLTVNVLACVVPVAMYLGFCGLGMRSAQQAAQQAQAARQAELDRQEQAAAERRQTEATEVATMVGLGAGTDGPVLCLAPLGEVLAPETTLPDGTLEVDLDRLVREFERDAKKAGQKYEGRMLRVQGTIQQVTDDGRDVTVVLQGAGPGANKIRCEFPNVPNAPVPRRVRFPMNRRVVVEGGCESPDPVDATLRLSDCKLVK
jgi:hypothetical protein